MALYAFDGTWNSDEVDDVQDTNVVRFKELYMGNNCEYLEGVGTRFGKIGRVLGGLFGAGGKTRIEEMLHELVENYKAGDKDIDIIGFSRGAALAVHFANEVCEKGVTLDKGQVEHPRIRFLGVWDIVGSFGLSFNNILNFQEINLGWNIDTVHKCVDHCFHAMALDERRESFDVTRLDEKNEYENIEEVWFRGVHSDVGGGNQNVARSNIALQWMLKKAREHGLPINDTKSKLPHYNDWNQYAAISENKDIHRDPRRTVLAGDQFHETAPAKDLDEGQPHTCMVFARSKYNWSGVTLRAGATYEFKVSKTTTWKDDDITCGPEGWASADQPWYREGIVTPFEKKRRKKEANWFALIGALGDEDEDLFIIGDCSSTYTAPKDAELYLFANDMVTRYGNNKGALEVTIKRIS